MKHNQRIGKWGEEAAAAYLTERGYEIVARNARTPYGEIDIVARQGEFAIFVEVKARTSNRMGLPEESVTPRKQAHMVACAENYATENEIDQRQTDFIDVEGQKGCQPVITHFERAIS